MSRIALIIATACSLVLAASSAHAQCGKNQNNVQQQQPAQVLQLGAPTGASASQQINRQSSIALPQRQTLALSAPSSTCTACQAQPSKLALFVVPPQRYTAALAETVPAYPVPTQRLAVVEDAPVCTECQRQARLAAEVPIDPAPVTITQATTTVPVTAIAAKREPLKNLLGKFHSPKGSVKQTQITKPNGQTIQRQRTT
jgi:hypothetical protein